MIEAHRPKRIALTLDHEDQAALEDQWGPGTHNDFETAEIAATVLTGPDRVTAKAWLAANRPAPPERPPPLAGALAVIAAVGLVVAVAWLAT